MTVRSPFDGRVVGEVRLAGWDTADAMLADAAALHEDRKARLRKFERIAILKRFRDLMARETEALAHLASSEGGKPLADSIIEVRRAVNGVEIAAAELMKLAGSEIPMGMTEASVGHIAHTVIEPAGPVLAISAFNHPVNLVIHQVVPAIAAGCPVIVKPARVTPMSCLRVIKLLYEAGLPERWARAIVCDSETAERMATDNRIKFVTFIGSASVGWRLRRNLAPGVRCSLEHGGSAPVIIEPDADIDALLPGIVKGGYYHAGQVCVSVKRVFAHKDIIGALGAKMAPMVKAQRVGDPVDPATEVGPLILPREVDRVEEWVREAVAEGATLLAGGRRVSDTCYEPTLLVDPPEHCRVSREEVFGPVVCLYTYTDREDAYGRANALPYMFQSALYTRSLDTAVEAAARLKAKTVLINEHTAFRVDWMPFGGAELSGLGTGGIGYAIRDMSEEKLVVIKSKHA